MRINTKIRAAVKFNPTKKSHQMTIADMCNKIKEDKITLPLYQRDLSWNLSKSVSLLNYQLFGKAPISPISINQISNNEDLVPQISFINRELIDENIIKADHLSVIDGQQRLTTNFKAYINHEDFRNIFLDVSSAKFKVVEANIKNYYIPVGVLLNEEQEMLFEYLENKNLVNELYPLLLEVRAKISNYNYTINIAENLKEKEQIEWFEVLNNAGSRVSALQMSFSKLKLENFDIYSDYINPFKEKIQSYGFDELFSPFTTNVSYPVSSLNPALEIIKKNGIHNINYAPIPSDTKEIQLTSLKLEELLEVIEISLESLDRALEFITKWELIKYIDRMDYILYLSGYFTFNSTPLKETEEKNLIKWVKTVSFSNKSNGKRREIFNNLVKNFNK